MGCLAVRGPYRR